MSGLDLILSGAQTAIGVVLPSEPFAATPEIGAPRSLLSGFLLRRRARAGTLFGPPIALLFV